MKNLFEEFIGYYKNHRGRVNGIIIGVVLALAIIIFGLLNSIFIALCAFLGYYVGKKFENDKNFMKKILDKLLPPGRYR